MEKRKAKKEEWTEASGQVLVSSISFSISRQLRGLLPPYYRADEDTLEFVLASCQVCLLKHWKYSLTHKHIHMEGKGFYLPERVMKIK